MSTPNWNDLERLWQSTPAAEPAKAIIRAQQRRRFASALNDFAEGIVAIAGVAFSIWVMTLDRPFALLMGSGTLLITVFASVASLVARFPRRAARPEDSVAAELDAAIHRARVSARWGFATFWIVAACLVFFAVLAFAWSTMPELPPATARRMLVALGIWTVWTAAWQAFGIAHYLRRSRELARLEEIRRLLEV